jgi:hypothetical protein
MNARKLALPLLVAIACLAAGLTVLPAAAATKGGSGPHAKPRKLHVDSIRVGTAEGPLVVRVAADVHSEVSLRLDGKPVKTEFEFDGPKAQRIALLTADGLHPGANRLRIRSIRKGVTRVAERTVKVPGWALLADAGEDVDTPHHTHARVGAAPPPGTGPTGADVNYSWKIVERPTGAEAGLADKDSPEPTLETKDTGTYVLQETADPEGNGDPTAHDQVTVAVTPNDPPIGVRIYVAPPGGTTVIGIGEDSYGGPNPISFAIVERSTRNVVDSGGVNDDDAGMRRLAGAVDTWSTGDRYMKYLLIVDGNHGIGAARTEDFMNIVRKAGVGLPSAEDFASLRAGRPFTIIGTLGAPAGTAVTRFPGAYDPALPTMVSGYLQRNPANANQYEYVNGEKPAFDTKAAGSTPTANKMSIAGQTYTGTLPAGATGGFHVVVLESLSLRQLSNQVLVTNKDGADNRALQADAGRALASAIDQPGGPTVFVQAVGTVKGAGPEFESLVKPLVRLGANPNLVNALDGSTSDGNPVGFAFVGRLGAVEPPAESSNAYDRGPYPAPHYPAPRLVGTLARGLTSAFVPNVFSTPTAAAPNGSVNTALIGLAYQERQGWPDLPGTPEESAKAQKFLCEAMGLCLDANTCQTVRECFWVRYSTDWNLKLTLLTNARYPGDVHGYSEPTFVADKAELVEETAAVQNVKQYLEKLQAPFEKSALGSYVDLQGISKTIYQSVQVPPEDNSTSWVLGLIGKVAALGGFAGPPISAAAAGLAATFGLASYLTTKSGEPIVGTEITARADKLGDELVNRIELAGQQSERLGTILVSDYSKLTTASRHIDTDWVLPPTLGSTAEAFRAASKQWFYEALIPTAFPYLIRVNSGNARSTECQIGGYGWPNQPDTFQMNAIVGYADNGSPITNDFFFTKGIGGGASPNNSIGDEMFRPPGTPNPGLGIEKLQFFTPRVFDGWISHAISGTSGCSVGWLPHHF